ncbi:MAG: PIG-L deacetylase family protein [Candidatus Brocadia sp.]
MKKLLRYIYKNLLPARISQSIDVFPRLRMPKVDGLQEKKVLVLSPHPDDDVIGCGGTLCRYHLMGAEIAVVYMTDGRKGNDRYMEDELVRIRQEEAKRASRILGIDKLIFLDNRDSELSLSSKTITELSAILYDYKPEAVFIPFFMDNHPDHIATSQIFFSAAKSLTSSMCYSYGIWTPLPTSNIVSDITKYLEKKTLAINEHKSQLELIDLTEAARGLSRYYSILNGGNGYAELFIACPLNEYRWLGKALGWRIHP